MSRRSNTITGAVLATIALAGCGDSGRSVGPLVRPTQPPASTAPTPSSAPSNSSSPTSAPGTPATPSTIPVPEPASPAAAPADVDVETALGVAARWVGNWVRPTQEVPTEQWMSGLRPLTTPEQQILLQDIDPANIPATRVTGPPRQTSAEPGLVETDVPTDNGTIHITVLQLDGQWLVSDWRPVEG